MRYLGHDTDIAADGWRLDTLACGYVAATRVADGSGPYIFKPATVRLDETEMRQAAASAARHRNRPDAEREQVGEFWDVWMLLGDGTFSRRAPERTKK